MKVSRRLVLRGIGGATLALPFLESFPWRNRAKAGGDVPAFAIFFRQANGVAAAQNTEVGSETEKFWPRNPGALDAANVQDRAVGELIDHASRLLVVGNVQNGNFDYGDGHAHGAMAGLTGYGPTVGGAGGDSEAGGESLDNLIGRKLNPNGRDSLFLYAGQNGGWLGGACISYRSAGTRRSVTESPWAAYQTIVGGTSGMSAEAQQMLAMRRHSINDLVRGQMQRLMSRPELSMSDRTRLDLHFNTIHELEVSLGCQLDATEAQALEAGSADYDETNGDEALAITRLHMEVAALAVACGQTRSVAIQFGNGNDGSTRFIHSETGQRMENYHYISHRRLSHDSTGAIIPGSDLLHHDIDKQFARTFKHLLDRLAAYPMPDGNPLLHHGVACWYNDSGNGPGHAHSKLPWVIAGSCGGKLKQGEYVTAGNGVNHNKLLATIGASVGVTNDDGSPLSSFGDPSQPQGSLTEILV